MSLTQAQASNGVYDTDGDKLIEIGYLEQLDAIRYDPNGDGTADETFDATAYADASACGDAQGQQHFRQRGHADHRQSLGRLVLHGGRRAARTCQGPVRSATATLDGLTSGTTYFYVVYSYSGCSNSVATASSFTTARSP